MNSPIIALSPECKLEYTKMIILSPGHFCCQFFRMVQLSETIICLFFWMVGSGGQPGPIYWRSLNWAPIPPQALRVYLHWEGLVGTWSDILCLLYSFALVPGKFWLIDQLEEQSMDMILQQLPPLHYKLHTPRLHFLIPRQNRKQ